MSQRENPYDAALQPLIDDIADVNNAAETFIHHMSRLMAAHHSRVYQSFDLLKDGTLRLVDSLSPESLEAQTPPPLPREAINPATRQPYPPGHDMPNIARRPATQAQH